MIDSKPRYSSEAFPDNCEVKMGRKVVCWWGDVRIELVWVVVNRIWCSYWKDEVIHTTLPNQAIIITCQEFLYPIDLCSMDWPLSAYKYHVAREGVFESRSKFSRFSFSERDEHPPPSSQSLSSWTSQKCEQRFKGIPHIQNSRTEQSSSWVSDIFAPKYVRSFSPSFQFYV